jgi:hypothetical protein
VSRQLNEAPIPHPSPSIYVLAEQLGRIRQSVFYNPELTAQEFAAASAVAVREVAPVLLERLADPRQVVRENAVGALSSMGLVAAPLVIPKLSAGQPEVRRGAGHVLRRLEDPQHLPPRGESCPGIALIKARLVPMLLELARRSDREPRAAAYRALARLPFGAGLREAESQLRVALRDDDVLVRRYAFEALDQLPTER